MKLSAQQIARETIMLLKQERESNDYWSHRTDEIIRDGVYPGRMKSRHCNYNETQVWTMLYINPNDLDKSIEVFSQEFLQQVRYSILNRLGKDISRIISKELEIPVGPFYDGAWEKFDNIGLRVVIGDVVKPLGMKCWWKFEPSYYRVEVDSLEPTVLAYSVRFDLIAKQ